MYYFLKGIVTEKISEQTGSEKLILEVNGIGFEINTTLSALGVFGKVGQETMVYTAYIQKEDGPILFGFPTLLEKSLFKLLCTVSGVGPKTALSILNGFTVSEICFAILKEDPKTLSSAQGIGLKTANRIILELKEKINSWEHMPLAKADNVKSSILNSQSSTLNEARSVLQALGYSSKEINDAFSKANGNSSNAEDLVHFSVKLLSR